MCDFNFIYNQYKSKWRRVGFLKDVDKYKPDKIGVYRAKLDERIMYIGVATEKNKGSSGAHYWGLHKRLNDYIRPEASGREKGAGPQMYQNKNELIIETIEMDFSEDNVELAMLLERLFIYSLKPVWNKM